jgi:hypothetical protein
VNALLITSFVCPVCAMGDSRDGAGLVVLIALGAVPVVVGATATLAMFWLWRRRGGS